MAPRPN